MIGAVTFDFWATLYVHDSPTEQRRQALRLERLGRLPRLAPHGLVELQQKLAFARQVALSAGREPYSLETARRVLAELEHSEEPAAVRSVARILEEAALDAPPPLAPGAAEAVSQLGQRYRLGLISDTGLTPGRVLRQILDRDGLRRHFAALTFSDETGRRKPDRHQFLATAAALGVRPEGMAHVGDLVETDIAGARSVGAKAILYIGSHSDQYRKHTADAIISDLAELPAVIERFNAPP